jgi:hypothetical protein
MTFGLLGNLLREALHKAVELGSLALTSGSRERGCVQALKAVERKLELLVGLVEFVAVLLLGSELSKAQQPQS